MSLAGKTILITGSTDGVGRAVATGLGAAGATVLVHGRDRLRGEAVCEAIRRSGNDRAMFYPADLSSLAAVRELAAAVARDHRRLDVLVNNAGLGPASARQRRGP
jgi:NAD(P)-dependent dehydrogenase (short-subunit alcohol dehydrogenase family)